MVPNEIQEGLPPDEEMIEMLHSLLNGYQDLAYAIVERCALDYREAIELHDVRLAYECEEFLLSSGPKRYAGMDGKFIMEHIRGECERRGFYL